MAVAAAALCLAILLGVGLLLWYYWSTLPRIDSISDYRPPRVTRLYDRNGRPVAELFRERRTFVGIDRIAPVVRNAFLAAEDADFYSHPGLDFLGMLRALWHDLLAGRFVQGGSTITQQLVKILLLTPERTLKRKIREMLLALRLESRLSKDEILTMYLNQINLGHGNYGVEEAARYYFGKSASELDLAQAATIAALAKSPVLYSPVLHPERSKLRRNWILDQMAKKGFVEARQAEMAKQEPVVVVRNRLNQYDLAPYYAEHCRRLLMDWFGADRVLEGGLKVRLAVDLELQRAAREAVASHLREIEKRRYGFRGALGFVEPSALDGYRKTSRPAGKSLLWDFRHRAGGRPE
ncbi:MAG: penicillin-binding protein, partial [Deltaproteobacteria bacterium]